VLAWVWTTLEFAGLCTMEGVLLLVNLRMTGIVSGLPVHSFRRLLPWGVAGVLFSLIPVRPMLFPELILVVTGGLSILYFWGCGVFRKAEAPLSVKLVSWTFIAVRLLLLWGRLPNGVRLRIGL
jgi:hypothetical protein